MDPILQQIARAQKRLLAQQFLSLFGLVTSATLAFGALGYATCKFWVMTVDPAAWLWSWVGGAFIVGVATTWLAAYCTRRSMLEAAIEVDRIFQLDERLSSSLTLGAEHSQTPAGRALLADAARQASRLDVRDGFVVKAPWTIGLPLLPALIVFGLALLVPDATTRDAREAQAASTSTEVIRKETDKLKQQLQEKRASLADADLTEMDELLRQLEAAVDELQSKENVDQKRAMIQINEMTKLVAEKRERLSGSDEMRKQFSKLKNIQQGPADKLAQAMKQGNFREAQQQLEKLKEQLRGDDLDEEDRDQLIKQLSEMQQKLQESARAFDEAKRALEQQIQQKMQSGDQQGANELQKKLNSLNQMNREMSMLDQMAQKLGECAGCMSEGDGSAAASRLDEISRDLESLQQQMAQLQTLDEMLGQLAECKQGMCEGDGMSPGDSLMSDFDLNPFAASQPGSGLGEGQGYGERPEDATETGLYDSQVAGNVQRGQSVVTGLADGPNLPGQAQVDVREAILSALRERTDPLVDEQIPRDQREHAKEYFQRFQPSDE